MSYNAANTYATVSEIQKRTGTNGWLALADVDADRTVDAGELTNAQDAIESANNIIDAAIQRYFSDPDTARVSGNDYLRDLCIDISIYKLTGMGGREIGQTVADNYDDALKALDSVRKSETKVPRLEYPQPDNFVGKSRRVPRAANIGHKRRR